MNEVKNMQDKTPQDIVCSFCARIIIPAKKVKSYVEKEINQIIREHKCPAPMESKRDFEQEVR